MTLDPTAQLRAEMDFMAGLSKELATATAQAKADGMTADQLDVLRDIADKLLMRQADLRAALDAP
jgi:hypothetical protein